MFNLYKLERTSLKLCKEKYILSKFRNEMAGKDFGGICRKKLYLKLILSTLSDNTYRNNRQNVLSPS